MRIGSRESKIENDDRALIVFRACLEIKGTTHTAEDFFHGLLLRFLALGRDTFEIKSKREAGDGRPDIAMKPRPGKPFPGVIHELKSPKVDADASPEKIEAMLSEAAKEARRQIDDKRYAAEMEEAGIPVLKYGVGFLGKRVALA